MVKKTTETDGAGLTKMPLRSFILSTLFGMIPLTFIYNYLGSFLTVSRTFVFFFGLIMVVFFFVLPILIEERVEKPDVHRLRKKARMQGLRNPEE